MARRSITDYVKIVSNSEKNKTYVFGIFTLFILLVLIVGALRPTLSTVFSITNDLKKKENMNEQLDKKISDLTSLTTEYSTISDAAEALPLAFPTQGNFSLFISNVEKITEQNGFELNNISFRQTEDVELDHVVLEPWSASLTIEGKMAGLIDLLEDFEDMPMYPIVSQTSYSKDVDDDGMTLFSITLTVFQLADPNFFE